VGAFDYVIGLTDKISAPARAAAGAIGGLGKSVGGLQAGLEALDGIFPGLGEALGTLGTLAMGIGAAVVGLVAGGAALALSASNFKDDSTEALAAMLGSEQAASATFTKLQGISDTIGLSQKRVEEIGQSLLLAGVKSGQQLENTVHAVADLETVAGASAADKLTKIIDKAAQTGRFKLDPKALVGTGVQVEALYAKIAQQTGKGIAQIKAQIQAGTLSADQGIAGLNAVIEDKLGGQAAKKLLDLDVQFAKFKDHISQLFQDVNVTPFLEGLKSVLSIFDSSTASGKALKWALTTVFDGFFAIAGKVLPYVKYGLEKLVIAGLKLYISLKPAIASLKKMFDGPSDNGTKKAIDFVVASIELAVKQIAWLVIGAVAFYEGMIKAYEAAASAFSAIVGWGKAVYNVLANLFGGGGDIASNFIAGLVGGIESGVGLVIDAVKGLGTSAMGAIKGVLGIASPSKEMAKLGGHTAAGFAQGVDNGSGGAQEAMGDMVAPPKVGSGGGGKAARGGGGTYSIEINASGGNASELAELVAAKLAEVLEQIGLEQGAPA
jgi:hypothetical protein